MLGKPTEFVVPPGGTSNVFYQQEEQKQTPTLQTLSNFAQTLQ